MIAIIMQSNRMDNQQMPYTDFHAGSSLPYKNKTSLVIGLNAAVGSYSEERCKKC